MRCACVILEVSFYRLFSEDVANRRTLFSVKCGVKYIWNVEGV